ncbi:MAG: NfeD family protein [Planctomycetaceae bacterium]
MTSLVWIAALVLVGMVMLALEVFVPSGGVLGFLSVVAIVAGVVEAFIQEGPAVGVATLAVVVTAAPAVLAIAFRIFPDTPLGRRVIPPPPGPDDVVPDADRRAALRSLVGRVGRATGDLLPWGTVEIDGIAHEAVSDGGPIPAGRVVEVVGTQSAALVVRGSEDPRSRTPAGGPARSGESDLEEALEAFDFESLGRLADGGERSAGGRLDSRGGPNNP